MSPERYAPRGPCPRKDAPRGPCLRKDAPRGPHPKYKQKETTMIQELQLRLLPEEAASEQALKQVAARQTGVRPDRIRAVRILKRSIDARQRTVFVQLKLRVYIDEQPQGPEYEPVVYPDVSGARSVVVVGAGPGGLFAALRLIELGFRPIVVERGKNVRERKKDIALISRIHQVDGESNYSFGEGGAGAYSDGKLYTRSKKRGSVDRILRIFCQHGASPSILADAHPHIGTDKLPRVIEAMREQILRSGGKVHFQTRMEELLVRRGETVGIRTADHRSFYGPVILATGHSARDVYRYLFASGVAIEAKGIAVGVRLEHPQALIDQIQYHQPQGRGAYLPAAEYSYVTQVDGRGVYSFCMCPGGFVVPAASGPEQVVVNGMSPSNRGSRWANSGMVVEIRPEDVSELMKPEDWKEAAAREESRGALKNAAACKESGPENGKAGGVPPVDVPPVDPVNSVDPADHGCLKGPLGPVDTLRSPGPESPLALMYFQEQLERYAWINAGRRQTAPAQRMTDFVNGKNSFDLPDSSYTPGLLASPLHFWLPPFVARRLQEGFRQFGRSSKGFLTSEATLIGVETRTSAPVRLLRDGETYQSVSLGGLFPCGEGAGYAGGIVSAAIDGERCAEAAAALLGGRSGE